MEYDIDDNGTYNLGKGGKHPREKYKTHSTFAKGERSAYNETTNRNICHIFHIMPRYNME
jgi:hypothetical protein